MTKLEPGSCEELNRGMTIKWFQLQNKIESQEKKLNKLQEDLKNLRSSIENKKENKSFWVKWLG